MRLPGPSSTQAKSGTIDNAGTERQQAVRQDVQHSRAAEAKRTARGDEMHYVNGRELLVQTLVELGLDATEARSALLRTNWSLEEAAELLLS